MKKFKIENFKWAIAGRSESKLKELLNSISNELGWFNFLLKVKIINNFIGTDLKNIETLVVSTENEKSIFEMCSKAKLIINCVGPVSVLIVFRNYSFSTIFILKSIVFMVKLWLRNVLKQVLIILMCLVNQSI